MHIARLYWYAAPVALLFTPIVAAQDTPGFEVYGGYSYFRLTNDSGLRRTSLNAWNLSAKVKFTKRISLVGDFSGDYGQRTLAPYNLFLPIPGNPNPLIQTEPARLRQYTFLFGPEVRVLHYVRLIVNVRVLAGVAHTNTLVLPLVTSVQLPIGPNGESVSFSRRTVAGGAAFAGAIGGSLDYRITDRLSYRILQPQLVLVNSIGSTPINVQLSTGVVLTSRNSATSDSSRSRVAFGIVAGGSLTDSISQKTTVTSLSPASGQETDQSRFYSTRKDYIVGPAMEFGLSSHLTFEIDGLYRPLNFTVALVRPYEPPHSVSPNTVVTWQFPLLMKYSLQTGTVRPLVEVGPSFRSSGNLNGTAPSTYGGTVGLGIEGHALKVRLAPVIRYTHWAGEGLHQPHTRRNQLEALVGLSLKGFGLR